MIGKKRKPKLVYKYREINQYSERLLSHRELYFPTIDEINDPFDGRIILKRDAKPQKQWLFIQRTLRNMYGQINDRDLLAKWFNTFPAVPALPQDEIYRKIDEFLQNPAKFISPLDLTHGYENILHRRRSGIRICSLTVDPASIPMWSYYADGHSGVCIGFICSDDPIFSNVLPVTYVKSYPAKNYFSVDDDEYYRTSLFTKSIQWQHEAEWRLMITRGKVLEKGTLFLPPTSYRVVVFGCNTTESQKRSVRTWIKNGNLSVGLQIAKPSVNRFELEISPYSA